MINKGDIVEIVWEDSRFFSDWNDSSKVMEGIHVNKPINISIGYVLSSDDNTIVIVQSYTEYRGLDGYVGNVLEIPVSAIRRTKHAKPKQYAKGIMLGLAAFAAVGVTIYWEPTKELVIMALALI